jgi:uroporphyrinogen III methyltransferase/synthase
MTTGALTGKTVLVTRAAGQSSEITALLEAHGAQVAQFPTIEIVPPDSWEPCDRAVDELNAFDGLIFASANGVRFFFERLRERGVPLDDLNSKLVYTVGDKTRSAVQEFGVRVLASPASFSAEDLGAMMTSNDMTNKRLLFPRGNLGDDALPQALRNAGAKVDTVVVYQTQGPRDADADTIRGKVLNGTIGVLTFTSPSTAEHFFQLFTPQELGIIATRCIVAAIGPTTGRALAALGIRVHIVAAESTVSSLVRAICDYVQSETDTSQSIVP